MHMFGMRSANFMREIHMSLCTGSWASMHLLQAWWERVPRPARIALFGISVIGMILGGSASGYWQ